MLGVRSGIFGRIDQPLYPVVLLTGSLANIVQVFGSRLKPVMSIQDVKAGDGLKTSGDVFMAVERYSPEFVMAAVVGRPDSERHGFLFDRVQDLVD